MLRCLERLVRSRTNWLAIPLVKREEGKATMSIAAHESSIHLPSEPLSGRRIALVVGVNGQPVPGRDSLKYAVEDAREMAEVLQDCCGFELYHSPLLGEDATSEKL